MTLQNGSAGPRDAGNQLAGMPATVGNIFTMGVTGYGGPQATQQFTLTILPEPRQPGAAWHVGLRQVRPRHRMEEF
jgi:hypothetical protein